MSSARSSENLQAQDLTPSLVIRLREGEAGAGELLNQLYRDAIYRFCWGYLGNSEAAEDAVQDVCFKVINSSEIPDNFRPWLYRIARNHCLNLLRGRRRRRDAGSLPTDSGVAESRTGQLTRLAKKESTLRLYELIGSLSNSQQEVLRLRYVEGLSRAEVAEILEIPESVVKSRLFEGLKKLRAHASLLDDR